MDAVNAVLAHKLGLSTPDPDKKGGEGAVTPMRQMRRALGRAADKAVGLTASVMGIAEEDLDVEGLMDSGPEGWVVIGLRDGANPGLTGLFLVDPALRSALGEMQTMGIMLPPATEERPVTRTDALLTIPFATQLLTELAEVGFGEGVLDPAAYDMGPMNDLRTAGLVMTQGQYRSWRITVQLGGGERQGEIMIAMRPLVSAQAEDIPDGNDWSEALHAALGEAPADIEAVLARMVLPMSKIEEFEVGQVIDLAGTTVGSVSLLGPNGEKISSARLGQVAGKRAVRIQLETIELQESLPKAAPIVAPLPDLEPPMDLINAAPIDKAAPTDISEPESV